MHSSSGSLHRRRRRGRGCRPSLRARDIRTSAPIDYSVVAGASHLFIRWWFYDYLYVFPLLNAGSAVITYYIPIKHVVVLRFILVLFLNSY